jgi:hypothetical protein
MAMDRGVLLNAYSEIDHRQANRTAAHIGKKAKYRVISRNRFEFRGKESDHRLA